MYNRMLVKITFHNVKYVSQKDTDGSQYKDAVLLV